MAESQARDLLIGQAKPRVVITLGNFNLRRQRTFYQGIVNVVAKLRGIIFAVRIIENSLVCNRRKGDTTIILEDLPWPQAFFDLLRKHIGIPSSLERFLCHLACDLMIAVAIGTSTDEDGSDDERARHADDAYHIREHAVVSPLVESLFLRFREAIVADPRPELLSAVITIGGQKLFRANQAQSIKVVRGHHVGATFSAVQCQQDDAASLSARLVSQHATVLIVGVSCNHH